VVPLVVQVVVLLLEVVETLEQEILLQHHHPKVITVALVQEINLLLLTWVLKVAVEKVLLEVTQ
jgi:hypothetical protein